MLLMDCKKEKSKPLVSIVMAVYNSESSIEESLKSLTAQSYKKIEIIIVLDGCKDSTESIVRLLSDSDDRIKTYKRTNHGLTKSLNYGINKATGSLIARQDSDDMSYPLRIQKQVEIMVQKTDVSLVGSEVVEINGSVKKIWPCPNCENIKNILKYRNIFAHSTAMFRRDDFLSVGGYDESFYVSQDFELWMRMSNKGEVFCIQEPLVIRVWSDSSITAKRKYEQLLNSFRARYKHRKKSNLFKIFLATVYQATCIIVPYSILNNIRKVLIFFGIKKI
jgi:glycosyltransferase involved in cell wall biosynthesis